MSVVTQLLVFVGGPAVHFLGIFGVVSCVFYVIFLAIENSHDESNV